MNVKEYGVEPEGDDILNSQSVADLIDVCRKRHKDAKDYPNVMICTNGAVITALGKKVNGSAKGVTIKYDSSDYIKNVSYNYKTDNHFIIAGYYPFLNPPSLMIMLYKDKKVLKEELIAIDFSYKIGTYYLAHDMTGYYLMPIHTGDEESPILNDNLQDVIQKDLNVFFTKKSFYKKNHLAFKRGVLLYGPPGNGKTSLIKSLLKNNTKYYSIIIDCSKDFSQEISEFFKLVLKDKKKILVLEDIDGVEDYNRSALLNFLDGVDSLENTFIIATTNNVASIDPALISRPSRFDSVYFFDNPNEKVRKALLKRFFPILKGKELAKCVSSTKEFSGAYFKEIFIFSNLHDCSVHDAIGKVIEQTAFYKQCAKDAESYLG